MNGSRGVRFSLSVVQLPWKDAAGVAQRSWGVELGLEKTDEKYLARVPIEGDKVLSSAVIALSFAPIIFMSMKPPANPSPAPDAQSRGYFVNVSSGSNMLQVLAAAMAGAFFSEDRIIVREFRVTAAHLRSQPAIINDPNGSDALETALLLDYDVDYDVKLDELDLSTTRPISTHIDGTGFVIRPGSVKWVQVPNGAYELGLSDPGLWNLGAIGKFLKLADIRLRKADHTFLVARLRLAQNFGGVKCDDFEISVDLESGQVKIESFPAKIEIEVAGAFKGRAPLALAKHRRARGMSPEGSISLSSRLAGGSMAACGLLTSKTATTNVTSPFWRVWPLSGQRRSRYSIPGSGFPACSCSTRRTSFEMNPQSLARFPRRWAGCRRPMATCRSRWRNRLSGPRATVATQSVSVSRPA